MAVRRSRFVPHKLGVQGPLFERFWDDYMFRDPFGDGTILCDCSKMWFSAAGTAGRMVWFSLWVWFFHLGRVLRDAIFGESKYG